MSSKLRHNWRARLARLLKKADRIPRGLRAVLGLVLIAGGVLGFLPILGFWMAPLGVAIAALDIPPLSRRLHRWADRVLDDSDDESSRREQVDQPSPV